MVQYRNDLLLDPSIHPFGSSISLRIVRSRKFAFDAGFLAELGELVRLILSPVVGS
jgi:hypothetical protein